MDALGNEEFLVSHNRTMYDSTLKYCNTVHSAQGDTIEGKFVIADLFSRHEGISKVWLYTAITRAADLNDIFFLAQSLYDENIGEVVKEMVRRYNEQDRAAKRVVNDDLNITDCWIRSKYRVCSQCKVCGEHMTFERRNPKKVTVNRLCNQLAHEWTNCELLCKECNAGLSDR